MPLYSSPVPFLPSRKPDYLYLGSHRHHARLRSKGHLAACLLAASFGGDMAAARGHATLDRWVWAVPDSRLVIRSCWRWLGGGSHGSCQLSLVSLIMIMVIVGLFTIGFHSRHSPQSPMRYTIKLHRISGPTALCMSGWVCAMATAFFLGGGARFSMWHPGNKEHGP